MTLAKEKNVLSIEDIRQNVATHLRNCSEDKSLKFIGFDNLEFIPAAEALQKPIDGTVFELIAGSLTAQGVTKDDGYHTVGDVMDGLGFHDAEEAHDASHWIGCHCHGPITGDTVADRVERL